MVSFTHQGSFKNIDRFLNKIRNYDSIYMKYGLEGVRALSQTTPIDSGETKNAWTYTIIKKRGYSKIVWSNTHIIDGVNIAIILQYGHGTRQGGFVQGRDYINPTLKPIFDRLAKELWSEFIK